MIGELTGIAKDAEKGFIILKTTSGVGYSVCVTEATKRSVLETECTLRIHTAVRKESIELFGFTSEEEYMLFILLLTISGVGPKKAIAVIESVPATALKQAVQEENPELLVSFGMGKKQAQRITLELQKKIVMTEGETSYSNDVITALLALGYSKKEALGATKEVDTEQPVEEQIKSALKHLRK